MRDRILGQFISGDNSVFYDLVKSDGTVLDTVKLVLKNQVLQTGTLINKENMLNDITAKQYNLLGSDATVNNALSMASTSLKKKLISTIVTSGNWVCPDGINKISALLVGGGGGGAVGSSNYSGGGSGYSLRIIELSVIPSNSYTISIGLGGIPGNPSGSNGGNTTAFGALALGGRGGATGATFIGGGSGAGGYLTNGGSFGNGSSGSGTTLGGYGMRGSIYSGTQTQLVSVNSNLSSVDNYNDIDVSSLTSSLYRVPLIAGGGAGGSSNIGGQSIKGESSGSGGGGLLEKGTTYDGGLGGGGGGGGSSIQTAGKGGDGCVLIFA